MMNNWSDDLRRDPPIWVQIPVPPSDLIGEWNMEIINKIDIKNFNFVTRLSILALLAGILIYIYWGTRYSVWYDIGIYSLTIVFVIPGILGLILSLMKREEIED